MAITVSKDDLFDGHSAKLTQTGWEITRVFKVTGLSGSDPEDKSCAAVDAVMTAKSLTVGMSVYPQTLRGIENAVLRTIIPNMKDTDTCFVSCFYSQKANRTTFPPDPVIEAGASVMQEESNIDTSGSLVTVSYIYPDEEVYENYAGKTHTVSEPITVLKPQSEYVVRESDTSNPTSDSIAYVGKINSNNGFIEAGDEGKWLCTAILGVSSDGGKSWDVTRRFQFDINGWNNRKILYRDDITGKVPDDVLDEVAQPNATATPAMYETANLGGLVP